jgi:Protein of unknown function (DUF4012)
VKLEERVRPEGDDEESPGRSRRRRWVLRGTIGVLAVLLLAAVIGVVSLVSANAVRTRFEEGKVLLTRGQSALSRGDADAAAAAFRRASAAFDAATRQPGVFLLQAEGWLPFVGRTPRAIMSMADIGRDVSAAGVLASEGLSRLPGGLSSLGMSRGRIPIDSLASLAPAIHRARERLESAATKADRLPDSWLLGEVAGARELLLDRLDHGLSLARAGDEMLRALPTLAGSSEPRRYFVAAQNSAELRGTGGLIGNYAILTVDDGEFSLGPFQDAQSLPNVPADRAGSPSSDFTDLYGPFGGTGFWLNLNMTPDAPTAATAIESLYARVTGQRLDGTILFDLQGLSDLLRATGPVRVDRLGATLTAQNVTGFVAQAGYIDPKLPDTFREGPRLVAEAVWTRFLAEASPQDTLHALAAAAGNGHLIVHAADPSVQAALRQAGVDGSLVPPTGDLFGVVLTNAAANKADYYLHEEARYDVTLLPEGAASAAATIRLSNGAPAGAAPSYPLGPHPGLAIGGRLLEPGENRLWTQVYCGAGCSLRVARQDGEPVALEAHRELGQDLFAGFVQEKAQESRTLTLDLSKSRAWEGGVGGGEYRLRVHAQPLINPPTVTVAITAPPGMNVVWSNVPMRIEGGRAVWSGTLTSPQDLVVRFRPPLPQRTWARIWAFLSRPAIRL